MRYSSVLSAAALLVAVSAAPLHKEKRDLVTVVDCVTEVIYKTVTQNLPYPSPTATSTPEALYQVYTTVYEVTPTPEPSPVEVYTVAPEPVYQAAPSPTPEVAAAPAPVASTGNSIADALVAAHNKYRSNHGCGSLTWDDQLASYAAANMPTCDMQHTQPYKYGENLAMGYGSMESAVDAWYAEGKDYNYANPGFGENTGHFTQVVWKGTGTIGCHFVESCNYLKCEYYTPGNFEGEYQDNVPEPISIMW